MSSWTVGVPVEYAHYLLGEPVDDTPVHDGATRVGGAVIGTDPQTTRVLLTLITLEAGPLPEARDQIRFRARFDEPAGVQTWEYGPSFPDLDAVLGTGWWTLVLHRSVASTDGEEQVENHTVTAIPDSPRGVDGTHHPASSTALPGAGPPTGGTVRPRAGLYRIAVSSEVPVSGSAPWIRAEGAGLLIDHRGGGTWDVLVEPDTPLNTGDRWRLAAGPVDVAEGVRLLAADGSALPGLPDPVVSGHWRVTVSVRSAPEDPQDLLIHLTRVFG